MDSLAKTLYAATSGAVNDFIDKLVAEFKIDKDRAVALWNKAGEEVAIVASPTAASPAKTKASAKKTPAKAKKAEVEDDGKRCQYKFIKGDKEGQNCGSKVSDESETGQYCKKHLGQEKKNR